MLSEEKSWEGNGLCPVTPAGLRGLNFSTAGPDGEAGQHVPACDGATKTFCFPALFRGAQLQLGYNLYSCYLLWCPKQISQQKFPLCPALAQPRP